MNRGANDELDLYQVLGVKPGATTDEITAAYYLLARDHHPDTSARNDPENQRFKSITAAYEVLSDRKLRAAYDQRRSGKKVHPLARQTGGKSQHDIHAILPISPEEARNGGACEIQISYYGKCVACEGTGANKVGPCEVCMASGRSRFDETLHIPIPLNTKPGNVLVLQGHGHETQSDPQINRGDLLLRVAVRPSW